jgi:uncharacterized protein (DUF2141 family)
MTESHRSQTRLRRARRPIHGPALAIGAAVLMAARAAAAQTAGAPIEVTVGDVWRPGGHVRVDVCTRETFLRTTCPYSGEAPAQVGETTVTVPDVPPGVYAIQAYHDVNDNHEVDLGFMGIPKEGVGFSRNPRLGLHGPSFEAAAVTHGAEPQSLTVGLHHFFHHKPTAPPAAAAAER